MAEAEDIVNAAIDLTAAAGEVPDLVVSAPFSQVHIPASEVDDHIIMRARQLASILAVAPTIGYSEHIIQLLRRMANDLAEKVAKGNFATSLAGEINEILLMIQREDGTDHIQWLCQQIANEIDETISGMLSVGRTV